MVAWAAPPFDLAQKVSPLLLEIRSRWAARQGDGAAVGQFAFGSVGGVIEAMYACTSVSVNVGVR